MRARIVYVGLLFLLVLAASAQQSRGVVSFPHLPWGVILDLPGFSLEQLGYSPDGRRYMLATNRATGVVFSIYLEELAPGSKARTCRESMEARQRDKMFRKEGVRIWEEGDRAFLEYIIPRVENIDVRQKNLFVCFRRDDVFVDLHFSKTGYQDGDDELFRAILDSLGYQEGIERTARDFAERASFFYLQREFTRAIPLYARALELEKQQPQLGRPLWYVVVDNLGMAYGISGDLERARETFEYGLSRDPEFPLFYYNLACTYAEMGDSEKARANLEEAFARRQNVLPGEQMPDPRKDSSFKKLMRDRSFRKFVDDLLAKR